MQIITCPKCGKSQPTGKLECVQCGVIFSKIKSTIKPPEPPKQRCDPIDTPSKDDTKPENFTLKTGLITCPACQKKISETVDACIHCGLKLTPEKITKIKQKQSKPDMGCLISIVVIIVFVCLLGFGIYIGEKGTSDNVVSKSDVDPRKKMIEKHFSSWDGSHIGLTKIIKELMNDPKSYEHVETRYGDYGNYLLVKTTFRGKNAFGGVVTNWISAKCDLRGNVIEIIDQGPKS